MRIDDLNLAATVNSSTSRTSASHGAAPVSGAREHHGRVSSTGDQVELSALAGQLSRAMAADSATRAARVEQLAKLYRSGAWQPDATATARALVQNELSTGKIG